MLFSWIREKLFKSKEVLTIDLRMASPSTAISQFYTEFLTTPMSQQWQSSISADDDHYSPMTPTVPSITSTTIPISTTTPIDIHAILHHCTNVIQMWSTFANELVQKAQQDRWFTLLFALIFLCISITIMFIFIKLPNYWSQSCSFQNCRSTAYEKIHEDNSDHADQRKNQTLEVNHSSTTYHNPDPIYSQIDPTRKLATNDHSVITLHHDTS